MIQTARAATHHDRILTEIRDNIVSGRWKPGHRLLYETDMAQRYGVSRMTINKVLTQLTREGFLERRRRLGTFVATPRVQSAVLDIADIEREISQRGLAYSYRLRARAIRPPTAEEQARLRPAGTGDVLAIAALHSADGQPFCDEDRLINLSAAPLAAEQDFSAVAAGSWLLREVPWSSATHAIRAVGATAAEARRLAIRAGDPCLEILRRTEKGGECVTWVRLLYPGERHQLFAEFSPSDG